MVKHALMGLALLGAVGYAAGGYAIDVESKNPKGMDLSALQQLQQQLTNQQALNQLSQLNGFNPTEMTMKDFAKALAVSVATNAMGGNFDMKNVLMDTGKLMMVSSLGGIQQPNIGGTGLNGLSGLSGLNGGTGINGLSGLSGFNSGDLLGQVVSKVIGGIQGGSSGGQSNFGGFDVASLNGSNMRTDANGNPIEFVQNAETGVFEETVVK